MVLGLAALLTLIMASVALAAESDSSPSTIPEEPGTASVQSHDTGNGCTNSGYECLPDGQWQGTFSNNSSACTWVYTFNWGDGSSNSYTSSPSNPSFTASHTYTTPGLYTINLSIPPGSSSDPEITCGSGSNQFPVEVPPPDTDGDGVHDPDDNCPSDANSNQYNIDHDDQGDVCDSDDDGDNVSDASDNCPVAYNPGQEDKDDDGDGDACDPVDDHDTDSDGKPDTADNCPVASNPSQEDSDNDGIGNACDNINGPGGDTTLKTPGYKFFTKARPKPYILDTQAKDANSDSKTNGGDVITMVFSESMSTTVAQDGSAFGVIDADGTAAIVTCGTTAKCSLIEAFGTALDNEIRWRQVMVVTLTGDPSVVSPGSTTGLQYPGTVAAVSSHFTDSKGGKLSLKKGDRQIEAA